MSFRRLLGCFVPSLLDIGPVVLVKTEFWKQTRQAYRRTQGRQAISKSQMSFHLFLEIFHFVLQSNKLNGVKEYAARLSIITNELFQVSLSCDWVSYFEFAIDIRSRYIPLYNWKKFCFWNFYLTFIFTGDIQ